jgi:hypothetical protein
MKKTQVISGAGEHQVALSPDQRLARSKRGNRQSVPAESQALARKKRSVASPELKNSPLESIPEHTGEAYGSDLEARIRQLGQVTEHLRAELETLTRTSAGKG